MADTSRLKPFVVIIHHDYEGAVYFSWANDSEQAVERAKVLDGYAARMAIHQQQIDNYLIKYPDAPINHTAAGDAIEVHTVEPYQTHKVFEWAS